MIKFYKILEILIMPDFLNYKILVLKFLNKTIFKNKMNKKMMII
jgi:hypothetical protein